MLKWTVMNKRNSERLDPQQQQQQRRTPSGLCNINRDEIKSAERTKRRHSTTSASSSSSSAVAQTRRRRRSSATAKRTSVNNNSLCLAVDKENQFTSTPIKSPDRHCLGDVLRDVSNLTPNEATTVLRQPLKICRSESNKKFVRRIEEEFSPVNNATKSTIDNKKKKKTCVDPSLHNHREFRSPDVSKISSKYFKSQTVDSHIEGVTLFKCECRATAPFRVPVEPVKSVKSARLNLDEICPPNSKRARIEHVNDFLRQISALTSPEERIFAAVDAEEREPLNISPLVKRLVDLNVNNNNNKNRCGDRERHDDSSFINDLSLDKIVDAILDSSQQSEENRLNETREQNLTNSARERRNSIDSGFRSSTTTVAQHHAIHDADSSCKCNNDTFNVNSNNVKSRACDKTLINLEETYNERCVDVTTKSNNRKRLSSESGDYYCAKRLRTHEARSDDDGFHLKRQKCIRRRKFMEGRRDRRRKSDDEDVCCMSDVSFDSNLSENGSTSVCSDKINSCETFTVVNRNNSDNNDSSSSSNDSNCAGRIRRCLSFDSPNNSQGSAKNSSSDSNKVGAGSMDLALNFKSGELFVNVIRCKNLTRTAGGQINAYVKVALTEKFGETHKKQQGGVQRTAVQANSNGPIFNHVFKLPILTSDFRRRLIIEVWHRDRILRRSEFLGCMSFSVKNVIKKSIVGSYNLLPQTTGGMQNIPVMNRGVGSDRKSDEITEETPSNNMCESQSSVDDIVTTLDEFDNELKKTTNKTILSQQQKDADENLFLRYLELDPMEGPDAIPAALQRKATGNQSGRTPFTTTKKLMRQPKTGFGFSVVWTHPPRIERVEKGLPADRAGILPGDYIIFVDKHNVVTMPEIDILNLIRSYGNTLTLEIFRRNTSRNGSVPSVRRLTSTGTESTTGLPVPQQRRPSTVCSTNTTSVEYSRKRLQLPQIAFNVEKPPSNADEARKRAMYQIISKEQQYATHLQFAVTRFVAALAERKDLITQGEHRVLFQNSEEILRIHEDILDILLHDEGENHLGLMLRTYSNKLNEITTAYKRYCTGLKKADCVLANKTKCSNSDFVKFLQTPQIPRKRPDITVFIHKPLEHYRELLKLFNVILSNTKTNQEEYPVISQIVHDLQISYREITAGCGLMEPVGEGRPLLSVQDLENRLVFTKCKPFVLSKPGRQWIFGGDLSRVEGRNVRQYWTLLFSDLLMFAKVSRDRVLFIIEEPLPLSHISELSFNIRKKANEFRITVEPGGKTATSPTVHCGPDLSRTPKKNANRRCLILRAPTLEMKAVWQNLLQRQIFHVNAGTDGSSFSSPLESPDAPITSSVATLQSAESLSLRRQTPHSLRQSQKTDTQRQIDEIIEHKCKQLSKSNSSSKCNAVHLEQWMKGELDYGPIESSNNNEDVDNIETWSEEMFRKRSEELNLIDAHGNVRVKDDFVRNASRCEDIAFSDHDQSPSRSTTTESQVTVRSSPVVPETVSVCRQCHRTCLSNNSSHNNNQNCKSNSNNNLETRDINATCQQNHNNHNNNNNPSISSNAEPKETDDDWQPLMLMGLSAINPAASLVKLDPFSAPVPKISVVPPTPDNLSLKNSSIEGNAKQQSTNCNCQNANIKPEVSELTLANDYDYSPDDSPQAEEQPYHSLNSSSLTLRRYGTVSSLERSGLEELNDEMWLNRENEDDLDSSEGEDEEEIEAEEEEDYDEDDDYERIDGGIDNEGFGNYSIRTWTARAGSFVAEKMAFFERLGENYRSGFFEGYLKTSGIQVNGDEVQEEETSGATSGEEIWGTPTSGGELDEPLSSPNYDERSPYEDSLSSGTGEDTELMMDELLMTPPVSASAIRGLLPRRTLEPLMEEEYSDSCTSSSTPSPTEPSPSPDQGNETGDVADECSAAVTIPQQQQRQQQGKATSSERLNTPTEESRSTSGVPRIHRSESYRHIIEAENENTNFFNRFRPTMRFVNIDKIPKSRGVKLLDFFNVKVGERKIHESFPQGRQPIKVFDKDDDDESDACAKALSPRRLRDKQLDRRFWKHLSRRRGGNKSIESAA